MPGSIVADGLTKWYGPRLAVDRVSFEVAAGEVIGLLGPNGSGKTTILRILTGYLRPSSGTARVAGFDVVEDPLGMRQRIGYVPENAPLYDAMRVREFLTFMARIKGLAGASAAPAVDAVTARLALVNVAHLSIGKLSKGFRQRVAIAQALLNDPDVLVLDEPTNGLDPYQIVEVRELIRSLAGQHTILVSSHILAEIAKTADRVAILLEGRILAVQAIGPGSGGRRVHLRVRAGEQEARACLGAVAGVKRVTVERAPGDGLVSCWVEPEPGAQVAESLAAALVGRGFGLVEMTETMVDLERLFLELTSHRAKESA